MATGLLSGLYNNSDNSSENNSNNISENTDQGNGITGRTRQSSAALILGMAIVASVASVVSIIGIPLLGITVPLMIISGTVLIQENRAARELNNKNDDDGENNVVVGDEEIDKLVSAMSVFGASDAYSLNRRDTDIGETSLLLLSASSNDFNDSLMLA